jgi:hypothetical protein
MTKTRAALFEDDEVDISIFKADAKLDNYFPPKGDVKAVSEQSGFSSREPQTSSSSISESDSANNNPAKIKKKPFNSSEIQKVQLNIRVSQEVADAFYRITKENEWSLGKTLKKAITALEKQISEQ